MTPDDPDLGEGLPARGSSEADSRYDWRRRERAAAEATAAEIKWPQLLNFDSLIREALTAILVRREAERAAERGITSDIRAELWRARLETRKQEFAAALELEICEPFSLDLISRPPVPAEWLKDYKPRPYSPTDVDAGFDPDTATFLRDGRGEPAGVVIQPHYLNYGQALGDVETVKYLRAIDVVEAPSQLGWISPKRHLLMWTPARYELCH